YRSRSGPCQASLPTSFELSRIDLGSTVPQAKEAGAIPLGPRDGKGDLGETVEGFAVPGIAIRYDHHAMGLSVPFADQNRSRRRSKASLFQPGQTVRNSRARTPHGLIKHLEGLGIEVTKTSGLKPVGDDPKQQKSGEMFGGRLAKDILPTNPQSLQIE